MTANHRIVVLFVTVFLSPACVVAADWTEFRGPNGDGHSGVSGLPSRWDNQSNVKWQVDVPGIGWSSPVVAGGRVFLTTSIGDKLSADQSLHVMSFQAQTGEKIWDRKVFDRPAGDEIHGKNSHASPTPIIEGDRIYVHFGSSGTACLTTDGKVLWKKTLEYKSQHGNGGSPAVAGDLLIICCDGRDQQFVVGMEKASGDIRWRTKRNTTPSRGFSFCTPTLITVNGKQQAVCPGSQAVMSYEPTTGREIWRVDYGEGYSVVPRPVFGHGLLFLSSGFGDKTIYAIDPTGSGDVTETHVRWKTKKNAPQSPSLLLVGDELFAVDDRGVATCFDAVSGDVHWRERLGGKYSASPFTSDGLVYFQSETGKTTVIRAGVTFEKVAENQIGDGKERTFASFAVVDRAILLRTENSMYRIEN